MRHETKLIYHQLPKKQKSSLKQITYCISASNPEVISVYKYFFKNQEQYLVGSARAPIAVQGEMTQRFEVVKACGSLYSKYRVLLLFWLTGLCEEG